MVTNDHISFDYFFFYNLPSQFLLWEDVTFPDLRRMFYLIPNVDSTVDLLTLELTSVVTLHVSARSRLCLRACETAGAKGFIRIWKKPLIKMEDMPRQRCETELTLIYCCAIWVWGCERPCERQQHLRINAPVNGVSCGVSHRGPAESAIPL